MFNLSRRPRPFFATAMEPFYLDWIALGSDGSLYIAPAEPGGWLQRKKYQGSIDQLVPVSPTKARTIAWYLYGDLGAREDRGGTVDS